MFVLTASLLEANFDTMNVVLRFELKHSGFDDINKVLLARLKSMHIKL